MPRWRLPLLWAYTGRDIARRPLRWLLTLAGIVLGVATAVAVLGAIAGTRDGYGGLFRPLAGRADAQVVPAGGREAFTPDLAALRARPGVRAVAGIVQAPSALLASAGPVPLLVLGVDPSVEPAFRDYSPALPVPLDGLRLERRFAARHSLKAGDTVRLSTPEGPAPVVVAALLDPVGPMRFNGGAAGIVSLGLARKLFLGGSESFTAVHVSLERGASLRAVTGGAVRPAGQEARLAIELLTSIEQPQYTLCAVAIVAGGLVIVNTVLMHLAERRRQLALLRAVGATSGQVAGLLMRQALLVGLAGTVLGVPLGLAMAAALLSLNADYLGVALPAWPTSPWELAFGCALGPGLATVAAWFPARDAASRPPLPDLAGRGAAPPASRAGLLGAGLLAAVALFIASLLLRWLPGSAALPLLPFAAAAFLIGGACVLPIALPVLLWPAGLAAARLGLEARLALRLADRQPERTALTVGVLFAAISACVAFGTSFENNMGDIDEWYRRTIDDAWLVRAVQPDPATVLASAPLPRDLVDELRRLPCVVRPIRFVPLETARGPALLIARALPETRPLPFALHDGDEASVRRALAEGGVLLGTPLAQRLGVGAGDEVELPAAGGPRRFRVAGLAKEYTVGGMACYMEYGQAARAFGFDAPHVVGVDPLPGADLAPALRELAERRGIVAQTNAEFGDLILRVARGVRLLVAGLAALIAVVAGVGVANTLAANLLDQTRDLGLLRALGMKRGQMARLVLAQAAILGSAGLLAGLPAGALLAWAMNATTPQLLGHHPPFALDWAFLGWFAPGTAAVVLLAAWWPAHRAARLDVAEALRQT